MSIEKRTFRSGPYADFIAQGVRVGDVVYLSGQVGMAADGGVPESIVEQTGLAYANIAAVLAEFGAGMDDIVEETVFVTDMAETMRDVAAVYGAREAAYGRRPDVAQTLVQVVALVQPELKIEIKCVAHL